MFPELYLSYGKRSLADMGGFVNVVKMLDAIASISGFVSEYGKHFISDGNIFDCPNLQAYNIIPPREK
jgi:hypothetical protein